MTSDTLPHIHIDATEDRSHAKITFTGENQSFSIELSPEQIIGLVSALGAVRQTLVTTPLSIEGARFTPTRHPSWAVQPDVETGGSVFAFQHPGYGPVGMVLTPNDAARLIQGLQMHRQLAQAGSSSGRAN